MTIVANKPMNPTSVTNKPMTDFLPEIITVKPSEIVHSSYTPRWQEACELQEIPAKYRNCCLKNCNLIPKGIVAIGRSWVENPKRPSLYLFGNTGSGKTHFAISLFREMIDKGFRWVIFKRSDDLDDELLSSIENKHERTCLEKYCQVPLLFIDDLGVERSGERIVRQYYKILDKRIGEGLTTVITSNVSKDKLNMGDRISSRLELFLSVEFPKVDVRKQLEITML